jgi:hypothetical protein
VVNVTPWPLYSRERPGTHCIRGRAGPRTGLDGCGKSRIPPGFDSRTIKPLASRFTDCAISAYQREADIFAKRKKSLDNVKGYRIVQVISKSAKGGWMYGEYGFNSQQWKGMFYAPQRVYLVWYRLGPTLCTGCGVRGVWGLKLTTNIDL